MQDANKAVFLDRDGTIIEDTGYISSLQGVHFIPGSIEAIRQLNEAGYKVIVITNQSGIARNFFSEDMLQAIDKFIHKQVLIGGGHIDAFYYCPHHPEHGVYPYRRECDCRKPEPGLIKRGAREHHVDLNRSFMIGDHSCDIEAGQRAGLRTIFVTTGHGKKEQTKIKKQPDHIAANLAGAVQWVIKEAK